MKRIAALLIGIGLLFPSHYLLASQPKGISAIFGDDAEIGQVEMPKNVQDLTNFAAKFGFLPPKTWKLAFNEIQGNMFMAEFVPANETLNDWTGLVCMQGFKELAKDVQPQAFLDKMADTYKEHCEGDIVYKPLGSDSVDGLDAVHGILGCTAMPNIHQASIFVEQSFATIPKGEIGYFTVVAGKQDIYLLHKSIRTAVFRASQPPLDENNYRQFMIKD